MKIEAGASVTPNVRLLRPRGEGGMGAVWVAEHLTLGTEVAVKFLHGEYAEDSNARARFSQEAAASSRVKSAHVVKVHDHGITDTNVPFIVMELLEGTDLSKRIRAEKTIPCGELLAIVSQLCKALARAHESGVIHRDIKPENVFLSSEGGEVFVKLLDFGIAKTEVTMLRTADTRRSTLAGQSLGTPYYMSPEQFRSAKQIDLRSDLWSVGVLVYEALTGVLPFVADTVSALAIVVNEGAAVPPSKINPALPAAIDAWFAKACAPWPPRCAPRSVRAPSPPSSTRAGRDRASSSRTPRSSSTISRRCGRRPSRPPAFPSSRCLVASGPWPPCWRTSRNPTRRGARSRWSQSP
jgi:serine/threonine-protein kinase